MAATAAIAIGSSVWMINTSTSPAQFRAWTLPLADASAGWGSVEDGSVRQLVLVPPTFEIRGHLSVALRRLSDHDDRCDDRRRAEQEAEYDVGQEVHAAVHAGKTDDDRDEGGHDRHQRPDPGAASMPKDHHDDRKVGRRGAGMTGGIARTDW